ncbi:MAG: hypothetical protein KJ737_17370 [Proteobacteria bacterium]|nr:hypothetical protein [Pseudomonadota bacterium]
MKRVVLISILFCFADHTQASDSLFLLQDNCVRCHLTCEAPGKGISAVNWKKSVHFGPDTGCADCHGGNKFLAMDFKKGHMGLPDGQEINDMCGKCHINEYKNMKSRKKFIHKTKKICEATCVTCHGYHNTGKADLSVINQKNCATCHSFEKVIPLESVVHRIQSKIKLIEETIAVRSEEHFPVTVPIRDLSNARTNLAISFHSLMSEELLNYLNNDLMASLMDIENKMSGTAPGKWLFQGMMILLFLLLCLILIKYYQMIVLPFSGSNREIK